MNKIISLTIILILISFSLFADSMLTPTPTPQYTYAFFKMPIFKSGSVSAPKIVANMNHHFKVTSSIVYDNNMCYIFLILPISENQLVLALQYGLQGLNNDEEIKYANNITTLKNIDLPRANGQIPPIIVTPQVTFSVQK